MYSYKFDEHVVGKARLEDIDASYKDLAEVCSNIRNRSSAEAIPLLEKAARGEMPILYRKYISRLAHRKELCGKPGRYPKKAAGLVLEALKSAIASAKAKGLSEDLIIVHAAANKKDVFPRLAPKGGKRSRSYYETARVEIVVREKNPSKKVGEKKPEENKTGAKKTEERKPEEKKIEEKKSEPAPEIRKPVPKAAPAHEREHGYAHVHEPGLEAKAKKKQAAPKGGL